MQVSVAIAEAQHTKRRAAEVAIAIDGLADRAATALKLAPDDVRGQVAALSEIEGMARQGCIERICAIANAYKHDGPLNKKHPINSNDDILATGASYGADAYGVGKYSGVEVFVTQRDGAARKVLPDVSWSIAGWLRFIHKHGGTLPAARYKVCNVDLPIK